jgi:hypothetical protein
MPRTGPASRRGMAVKVVRTNGHDEIVARTNNLLVGRPAFETARRLYPHGRVDYHPVRFSHYRVADRSDTEGAVALSQ